MKPKLPTVFWGNERVSHGAILMEHQEQTRAALEGRRIVLAVQDTTSFNFSHHPASAGLGYLENDSATGFLAHTTLAVSEWGVPVGILEQAVWVRSCAEKGKRHQRHERDFESKESYKWVKGLGSNPLDPDLQVLTICDREAHIYDFLAQTLAQGHDFIVRASQGRSFIPEGGELFQHLEEQAPQAQYDIELTRHPEREARSARVELRYAQVTLKRPQRSQCPTETLTIYAIEVCEIQAPDGETPVHWLLLTSLVVDSVEQAQEAVRFYTYRWLVERFHYVLKSGCRMEESQLREVQRLQRLLALYSLVAWRLLWLCYEARQNPNAPCTCALNADEWQALYCFVNASTKLPTEPPSLRQAVRWIAQLGGFLARKGDGDPGVKVLWRGWSRLQDLTKAWLLFHSTPPKNVGNG